MSLLICIVLELPVSTSTLAFAGLQLGPLQSDCVILWLSIFRLLGYMVSVEIAGAGNVTVHCDIHYFLRKKISGVHVIWQERSIPNFSCGCGRLICTTPALNRVK